MNHVIGQLILKIDQMCYQINRKLKQATNQHIFDATNRNQPLHKAGRPKGVPVARRLAVAEAPKNPRLVGPTSLKHRRGWKL